ncbi:hypothetical protein TNCV_1115291 [Trichonephila clavipes]|nr:hypothetical protein TNCV_1115291 [Trichonephila clavipes]
MSNVASSIAGSESDTNDLVQFDRNVATWSPFPKSFQELEQGLIQLCETPMCVALSFPATVLSLWDIEFYRQSSPPNKNLKNKINETVEDVVSVSRLATLSSLATKLGENYIAQEPSRKLWD